MADSVKRILKEFCVIWGSPEPDGFGGSTFSNPVQAKCRWDDVTEVVIDPKGQDINSNATIYLETPVTVQSYIMRGPIDSNTPNNPTDYPGAFPVRLVNSYSRRNKPTLYVVRL